MRNVLNLDPTRTTLLRKRMAADMSRRFASISRAIWQFIVVEDAYGLSPRKRPVINAREFEFLTNPEKVRHFRTWLQERVDGGIMSTTGNKPWLSPYIESSYRKGMIRSYTDTHAEALAESPAWYAGSRAQFIETAFASPIATSKVEMLYERAFTELKGVTATMDQQLSRILADGLVAGESPTVLARKLRKSIGTLSRTRARAIAHTEIIRAHAEGQLDAFEALGVKEIRAQVEFSTAQDERVCSICEGMEGNVYTIDKARGIIPVHPFCRCAWIPAEDKAAKTVKEKPSVPQPAVPGPESPSFTEALTLKEAKAFASKNNINILPRTVKEGVDVQAEGIVNRYGPWKEQTGFSEAELRENWRKAFASRTNFQGINYPSPGNAFKNLNEERVLRVQNAINDNATNPLYNRVLQKNTQQGRQGVILRREPKGITGGAEQIGGTTHVFDSPLMDKAMFGEAELVPLPGAVTSGATGGISSTLRHEFGHTLFDKTPPQFKRAWGIALNKHTADEIGKGISIYSRTKMHLGDEAFCELFSMRTSRKWDASKFPKWVRDLVKMIEDEVFPK